MPNKMDFQKAVELIGKSNKVLITTHTRPDGDGCGCIAAISETLTTLGKNVKILLLSELPAWYEFLFEQKPEIFSKKTKIDSDLIIIVDTDTYNQLLVTGNWKLVNGNRKWVTGNYQLPITNYQLPILVIDHHVTSDPRSFLRSKSGGDVRLIDNSAAATALIVFDLLKYAGWPITKKIAEALFVAVSTDTGWFQFDNTDSRTFKVCAELIDAAVIPSKMYRQLYQNFSPQQFRLMVAMLNTLELHRLVNGKWKLVTTNYGSTALSGSPSKDKLPITKSRTYLANRLPITPRSPLKSQVGAGPILATQHLTQKDFKKTGAKYSDTENLIDQCRRISTVEAAALFVEQADGQVKVSLRSFSRDPSPGPRDPFERRETRDEKRAKIDVCKIAAKFGGGGHKLAAGAHLPGPIEKAKKLILTEMAERFKQLESK